MNTRQILNNADHEYGCGDDTITEQELAEHFDCPPQPWYVDLLCRLNHYSGSLFMDGNFPGVVYMGDVRHKTGLANMGGCPSTVSRKQAEALISIDRWDLRKAPDFWVFEID